MQEQTMTIQLNFLDTNAVQTRNQIRQESQDALWVQLHQNLYWVSGMAKQRHF